MRILYIDNRRYGHNSDLHIHFIQHLHRKKYHNIFGYGRYMDKYFSRFKKPGNNVEKDIKKILKRFNPDLILTYNCNGSSYEVGLDNVARYKWVSNTLKNIDHIPKFHVTTDYCRSGFRKKQAKWFKEIGYSAAIFRHKVALNYPIDVDSYWLPFSIDEKLYKRNIEKSLSKKRKRVGFIGAAHNSAKKLYANRIVAIDFLLKRDLLQITEITNKKKFERKMLFGDSYVKFLTSNLFGLTCGGTCDFMTAKYFQIPAAYSMLVCAPTKGLEIFPDDTYILYDKDNLEKLYHDIIEHVDNSKMTKKKMKELNRYVLDRHNHDVRARELTNIFKRYL